MKFVIAGAGGIGCYYGARLQAAGHGVIYVARGAHLAALQQHGLELQHPEFNYRGPVEAMGLETLGTRFNPADFDALLICAKATATQEIATLLCDWFQKSGQCTRVISLQNGVDNEIQLSAVLGGENVIGGLAVLISGHVLAPGVVSATGIAQIIFGAWPAQGSPAWIAHGEQLAKLETVFNEAGIPSRLVPDIRRELWRKLLINNGVNPLSALTRLDTRSLCHHPHFGPIVLALVKETAAAARADGENMSEADIDQMFELIRSFDPVKTSMLVDLEKGRPLELEAICGAVLTRAMQLKLQVPYTETLYSLLKHATSDSPP